MEEWEVYPGTTAKKKAPYFATAWLPLDEIRNLTTSGLSRHENRKELGHRLTFDMSEPPLPIRLNQMLPETKRTK